MTLETRFALALAPQTVLDAAPVARMRVGFTLGMTLDTDIAIRMADRAGLQIAPRFNGMLTNCPRHPLTIGAEHQVRLDLQAPLGIPLMALGAGGPVVATVALLRVVGRGQRVPRDEVVAVAARHVVLAIGLGFEVGVDPAAGVAVKAVGLGMTLLAVAGRLAGQQAVSAQPIAVVVRGDPFRLVAAAALRNLGLRILLVRLLLSLRQLCSQHGHDEHC